MNALANVDDVRVSEAGNDRTWIICCEIKRFSLVKANNFGDKVATVDALDIFFYIRV